MLVFLILCAFLAFLLILCALALLFVASGLNRR